LFVGYQAENTLGRKLADGEKTVRIFGEECQVQANIAKIDGYSAHADEQELLEFIGAMPLQPRRAFVVHGEPEATRAFASSLRELGVASVTIPERGQKFEI
jgi:metallo-beta-lactamase family protein